MPRDVPAIFKAMLAATLHALARDRNRYAMVI
jgi:hypothetical protein